MGLGYILTEWREDGSKPELILLGFSVSKWFLLLAIEMGFSIRIINQNKKKLIKNILCFAIYINFSLSQLNKHNNMNKFI